MVTVAKAITGDCVKRERQLEAKAFTGRQEGGVQLTEINSETKGEKEVTVSAMLIGYITETYHPKDSLMNSVKTTPWKRKT